MLENKVLDKFNNILKNTIESSNIDNVKIEEEGVVVDVNSYIVIAKGFTKIPVSSIKGIKGRGNFKNIGTSGHRISFQYSLFPKRFTATKVQSERARVTAMFPVTFAPPGKNGTRPIRLLNRIKKNTVSR